MVEQFSEKGCLVFVVSNGFGAVLTSRSLHALQSDSTSLFSRSMAPSYLQVENLVMFMLVCCLLSTVQDGCTCSQQPNIPGRCVLRIVCVYFPLSLFKAIQRNAGVFFVVNEGCGAAFTSKTIVCSLLSNVVARHRFQWPCLCCKRKSRCRFCQFVVRHFPSRLDPLARNSQVSQGECVSRIARV